MIRFWEVCHLVSATGIVKSYGREKILFGVDLTVGRREIVCVVGPNGSGKSTLLSVVAGLIRPDSGQILFDGKPLASSGGIRGAIGIVPQQDSLFEELSVRDNLSFWAAAAKVRLKDALARPAVGRLELEGMLGKRVSSLSGGMRRRVAVAIGLLSNPALLILDEPFAGLDLFFKRQLIDQLTLLRQDGTTILYTSHNADEVVPLCDRVYLLIRGKVALNAPSDTLPSTGDGLSQYMYNLIIGDNRL